MTICCGLSCTASKILGALQAILHITCIFGVLQPPKCGSSVKKNAGLISPPPRFEPPRPWPPPPPAPCARPVRRSGRRSEKAAFCHRAPFSGQKRLFFRAGAGKNRLYSERPDGLRRAPRPSPGKTSPQQSGAAIRNSEKPSFWRKRSQPWQKEGLFRDGTGRWAEERKGRGGRATGQRGAPWDNARQSEAARGSARQRRRN